MNRRANHSGKGGGVKQHNSKKPTNGDFKI